MRTFDQILADAVGEQAEARLSLLSPVAWRDAVQSFSWYLNQRPESGASCVDRLDTDTALTALRAAADLSIALGRRLNQLREQEIAALPQRLAEPCGYCGKPDCDDRWQHDREDRGHEVTIWKAAKS